MSYNPLHYVYKNLEYKSIQKRVQLWLEVVLKHAFIDPDKKETWNELSLEVI